MLIPRAYGATHEITLAATKPIVTQIASVAAIWAVEGALLLGILTVFVFAWRPVIAKFADGSKAAVAGALLASMNTASEYGFGGVIALLAGLLRDRRCAQGDSQSADQRGDQRDGAGRHHRVGLRRHEHRAGRDVRRRSSPRPRRRRSRSRCCTASPRWRAAAWTRCRTTAPSSRCSPSPASPTSRPTRTSS